MCWPASLTYSLSSRPLREPISKNKVEGSWGWHVSCPLHTTPLLAYTYMHPCPCARDPQTKQPVFVVIFCSLIFTDQFLNFTHTSEPSLDHVSRLIKHSFSQSMGTKSTKVGHPEFLHPCLWHSFYYNSHPHSILIILHPWVPTLFLGCKFLLLILY